MVPGIGVACGTSDLHSRLPHSRPQFRMRIHHRGRAFLDHFLMPALDGAFPLAQVDQVAVVIPQDLDLDMARLHHQLFQIDLVAAESAEGFAGGVAQRGFQVLWPIHPPHSFSASAGGGFEEHRIAQFPGRFVSLIETLNVLLCAGNHGSARGDGHSGAPKSSIPSCGSPQPVDR